MAKFKVGDRVHVVNPEADFMCREESYMGDFGTVTASYEERCDVRIERNGQQWAFSNKELTAVDPEIVFAPETPTLRDQFAMAALISATEMAKLSAIAGDIWTTAQIAECAYQFADAMLAERERAK